MFDKEGEVLVVELGGPAKVNHLVQAAAEKVVSDGRHVKPQNSQKHYLGLLEIEGNYITKMPFYSIKSIGY